MDRKCSSPVRLQTRPCISRWINRAGLGLIWKASRCTGSCSGSGKTPWSSGISGPRHQRGAKPGRELDWPEAQVLTVSQACQRSCLLTFYLLPASGRTRSSSLACRTCAATYQCYPWELEFPADYQLSAHYAGFISQPDVLSRLHYAGWYTFVTWQQSWQRSASILLLWPSSTALYNRALLKGIKLVYDLISLNNI